jgi:hypothetical protein
VRADPDSLCDFTGVCSHGNDHLSNRNLAFHVGVSIGFTGVVVAILINQLMRHQLFKSFIYIKGNICEAAPAGDVEPKLFAIRFHYM